MAIATASSVLATLTGTWDPVVIEGEPGLAQGERARVGKSPEGTQGLLAGIRNLMIHQGKDGVGRLLHAFHPQKV